MFVFTVPSAAFHELTDEVILTSTVLENKKAHPSRDICKPGPSALSEPSFTMMLRIKSAGTEEPVVYKSTSFSPVLYRNIG
jgi:hypothetical protein